MGSKHDSTFRSLWFHCGKIFEGSQFLVKRRDDMRLSVELVPQRGDEEMLTSPIVLSKNILAGV